MGGFVVAETLRGLNEQQKIGRLQLGDRLFANDRENHIFQITAQFFGVLLESVGSYLTNYFRATNSKVSRSLASFSSLACFFPHRDHNPFGRRLFCVITPMAGIFQGNRRIRAKMQKFLLALKPCKAILHNLLPVAVT